MSSLRVRPAEAGDLDALVAFNLAMAWETEHLRLDEPVLRRGIARLLAEPALGRYLLAIDANAAPGDAHGIVGALMLTTEWSDWRNGLFWWIQSVYVLPQARRCGVYRALHERVRAEAKATQDVIGIRLYVERENVTAQQTYLALGMHETVYRLYEETFAP